MKKRTLDITTSKAARRTKDDEILKRSFDPKQAMFLSKKCSGRRNNKKRGNK